MYRGSFQTVGNSKEDPDYVYYNASIINNSTTVSDDTGQFIASDPAVRFNETRDKEILQNAGDYYFSIIRLQLNGTGRDLPLFIPTIQSGGGNADVNLTTYGASFSYSQTFSLWNGTVAQNVTITVCPELNFVLYFPETTNPVIAPVPSSQALAATSTQDISTRYYWVYTYQWWLQLVNRSFLNPDELDNGNGFPFSCAWGKTYQALLNALPEAAFVFPTLRVFNDYVNCPQLVFNPDTNKFSVYGDSDGFGQRIQTFLPGVATALDILQFASPPKARMFMNSNMFGLFANLPNQYWNTVANNYNPFTNTPLSPDVSSLPAVPTTVPVGLVNEIRFFNKFYTNVADYRLSPESGRAPLGYVPIGAQKPYWVMEQEMTSTDSLWSPIESLVVTSNLLSVASEYTSPPVALGTSNNVFSSPTAPSAFEPIVTDVMFDSSTLGSHINRQYYLWEPKAEFRLADFQTKGTAVKNIDIQIFWRSRLNGNLYPLQMFNLSSVSIKAMFKHRSLGGGKGAF
jgi:hypothetical protein